MCPRHFITSALLVTRQLTTADFPEADFGTALVGLRAGAHGDNAFEIVLAGIYPEPKGSTCLA
jgi:hypothetical protein